MVKNLDASVTFSFEVTKDETRLLAQLIEKSVIGAGEARTLANLYDKVADAVAFHELPAA